VRQEAARALGTAKELTTAAEALRAALGDPDSQVREAAADSLARLAPDRAEWALAVKPFDPVAVGPMGVGLRDTKPLTSSEGRRIALPAMIAAHQLEPLRPLATSGAPEVKPDSWAALGRMGGDDAAELLRGQAFDKSQTVELRKAAYRAHKRARRAAERTRKGGSPS
jgi:ParB family chromosome partitioning protein